MANNAAKSSAGSGALPSSRPPSTLRRGASAVLKPHPWTAPEKQNWDVHVSTRTASLLHRCAVQKNLESKYACLLETEGLAVDQAAETAVATVYPPHMTRQATHRLRCDKYWTRILSGESRPDDVEFDRESVMLDCRLNGELSSCRPMYTTPKRHGKTLYPPQGHSGRSRSNAVSGPGPLTLDGPMESSLQSGDEAPTIAPQSPPREDVSETEDVFDEKNIELLPMLPEALDDKDLSVDPMAFFLSGPVQGETSSLTEDDPSALNEDGLFLDALENADVSDWLYDDEREDPYDPYCTAEEMAAVLNHAKATTTLDGTVPYLTGCKPMPRLCHQPSPEWFHGYPTTVRWSDNLYKYLFNLESIRRSMQADPDRVESGNEHDFAASLVKLCDCAPMEHDDEESADGRFDLLQIDNFWNQDVSEDVISFFLNAGLDAKLISHAHLTRLRAIIDQVELMIILAEAAIRRHEKIRAKRNYRFSTLASVGGDKSTLMRSKGLGSTLREVISVDEEWPTAWQLSMQRPARVTLYTMGKKEYHTSKKEGRDGVDGVGAGAGEAEWAPASSPAPKPSPRPAECIW